MEIIYKDKANISVESAIKLYNDSTLGERRPVDRPDIFKSMLGNADITISAWHGGICRTLTDYSYVAYLSDLAFDVVYQRKGIGKRLIEETKKTR